MCAQVPASLDSLSNLNDLDVGNLICHASHCMPAGAVLFAASTSVSVAFIVTETHTETLDYV